jgi:predicted nucleic acid-binding protein
MFLADTNVFLEILLEQDKSERCKAFIRNNIGNICISDFSLHSIGVIAFRTKKPGLFTEFSKDILPGLDLVSLPIDDYKDLETKSTDLNLDFDDIYQYLTAQSHHLTLVTLDKDFKKSSGVTNIHLL